jgi:hypothetical protein
MAVTKRLYIHVLLFWKVSIKQQFLNMFDCCKQSLESLLHPSIHPSIYSEKHSLKTVYSNVKQLFIAKF